MTEKPSGISFGTSENARIVLEERYLRRDLDGRICETPEQLIWRVASTVALAEGRQSRKYSDHYFEMMSAGRFLPNTPTLMNAGKTDGQLSACYVLPVGDSLESIFESLKQAAIIHQSGGGTGFSFSSVRPKGSAVRSTHGTASGPVSFMRIFDVATETIKQGGVRRGANMGVLRVDHPDILEFIDAKRDLRSIINFNISVGITSEFMRALSGDEGFTLRRPHDGKPVQKVSARELFRKITEAAWVCGDPGLVFLDRINAFNPTPRLGSMESTNPCGEQPLLSFESCNLGSLNLGAYFGPEGFDWPLFRQDIRTAIRFLDNVVDVNVYPVRESGEITRRNRKTGLGVMGFADLLLLLGIAYDSPEAVVLGERIMSVLDREAKRASASLAEEKGAFPNWRGSFWDKLGYPRMRNATVSTVAPTGTISILAGASSGIEPIFSGVFYRNVLGGKRLMEVHPAVKKVLKQRGLSSPPNERSLARMMGSAWRPAREISVESHVEMQAAFQRHSDSAVSKTINLPKSSTPEDIGRAYLSAHQKGCKGITVYRDQSRPGQVLEAAQEGACDICLD